MRLWGDIAIYRTVYTLKTRRNELYITIATLLDTDKLYLPDIFIKLMVPIRHCLRHNKDCMISLTRLYNPAIKETPFIVKYC